MIKIISTENLAEAREISGKLVPFRAPHYTTSDVGIIDELRMAVGGVLYLDECEGMNASTIARIVVAIRGGGALPLAVIVNLGDGNRPEGAADARRPRRMKIIEELARAVDFAKSEAA